ncbi:MAG TPA: hypothetical protein VFA46_16785 [Actinomycetes bacterium]|nr:hypothetical protein [Actinomycetes bacterium]
MQQLVRLMAEDIGPEAFIRFQPIGEVADPTNAAAQGVGQGRIVGGDLRGQPVVDLGRVGDACSGGVSRAACA